ncbi:head decoration protein [Luteibacter yeojuensis]|uniref:Head decoration protein n=1 Tax=Luteibacter yeojuensis TaxID=345309 RepID=A0A7X5QTY9_9GAMM|nr:head decoration protein [Luteibacter yeojuensis]NID15388.1 head decoration protein [Luteibacter yeojuensis]
MTLTPSIIGDNVQQPGIQAQVYIPDQLIADARNLVSQPIILGAGNLKRGTVLGQQTAVPVTAAAAPGNTGNGTIGSLGVGSAPRTGRYTATATAATTFAVVDPEGASLGNATVGTAFTSTGVGFTITAGGTAFVAGDAFYIDVEDAVGVYIQSVRTASDGSQNPVAILADDADASAGPVTAGAYLAGEFNAAAVIRDASWTLPQVTSAARAYGIFLKSSVSAAPPSNNSAP